MAWSFFSLRARRACAFIIASALLSPVVILTSTAALAQPATDAKASLADGDKAAKAKDWATAARSYDAANKASPSSEALESLANAQYQAGQLGEAYASYTEWMSKYGAKAAAAKKATATARLKELGDKTGTITVTVNEAGSAVLVDDKQVGTSPLAAPLRLAAGPHRIRVTKDGFNPFDQAPNVTAGGAATLQVDLVAATSKAKLVVKEKTGKPIRVIIDGVDVGDAPWTGEVEAGAHDVGARGAGLVAAPEKVTLERGKAKEVELVASASSASVKIGTEDGKGLIFLDDKLVGEGSFIGDIPAGPHKLKITREGYDPFEEDILVKDKEPYGRTVVLKLSGKIETGPVQNVERLEGIYGGFSLAPVFTPGGTGSDMERTCENKPRELASCDVGSGIGGGVGGFIGYHWDPVGIELFFAGQYDQSKLTNDWNAASTDPGIGPDPARTESFSHRRVGGMGAARIRLTKQWTKIRIGFAAGIGVSYRAMFLERETLAKDNSGGKDLFVSDKAATYWSPVVILEPSVMYRITPGVAASLGLQLFLDAPSTALFGGENPRTNPESSHVLAVQGQPPRGLATPSYELASNMQIFIGPFIGMMFGP